MKNTSGGGGTESEGRITSGNLVGRSMLSAILILSLPVLFQQTMVAMVGLVDKMLAAQLPEEIRVSSLDAIGIGSYIGWFIGIAMAGIGIGGQALIARAMGAGRHETCHLVLGRALTMSALWGCFIGVLLWFLALPMAGICGLSADATTSFEQYMHVIAIGMPCAGIMIVGAMCLLGSGETLRPAIIAIVVCLMNACVSWVLSGADLHLGTGADAHVLVNPFSFDLHVAGIAAGTSLSYLVGAIATIAVVTHGVKDLRLQKSSIGFDGSLFTRIARIGIPNFFEGMLMWTVNIIILIFIGMIALGEEGLQGAHAIAIQWEAFSFMPGFAIGSAAGTLAGQYLGAGNPRMAQRAVLICAGIAVLFMSSVGIVFILHGEALTAFISREPVHMAHTPRLLFICGVTQCAFALCMVIRQALRGVGDTTWALILTAISSYGIRLPACWMLGVHYGLGLEGIWYALCGEFIIRAGLFCGRFFHGGWKTITI